MQISYVLVFVGFEIVVFCFSSLRLFGLNDVIVALNCLCFLQKVPKVEATTTRMW